MKCLKECQGMIQVEEETEGTEAVEDVELPELPDREEIRGKNRWNIIE